MAKKEEQERRVDRGPVVFVVPPPSATPEELEELRAALEACQTELEELRERLAKRIENLLGGEDERESDAS